MAGETVADVGGAPGGATAPLEFVMPPGQNAEAMKNAAQNARKEARARVALKVEGTPEPVKVTPPAIASLIPQRVRDLASTEDTAVDTTPDTDDAPIVEAEASATPKPREATEPGGDESVEERVLRARDKAKANSSRHRRLMAEKQALEVRYQAQQRELAQARQQAEHGRRLQETWQKDPVAALALGGMNPDQLVDRVMRAGTPEEKLALMQAQIDSDRAERKKLEQTLEQQRHAANFAAAETACYARSQNVEKYPNLQGYEKDFILGMVETVARKNKARIFQKTGVVPTFKDAQILSLLNERLPRKNDTEKVTQPAKGGTSGSSERPGKSKSAGKPPRTLTSTTTQSGVTRPNNWESLPRSERLAALKGQ